MNLYSTTTMLQGMKSQKPTRSFLRDTYFPSGVTFASESVIIDYEDEGSEKLAPGMKAGAMNVQRAGFTSKEMTAPMLAVKRILTASQTNRRVFNESVVSAKTPEQREAALLAKDLNELDAMITRREEWMCAKLFTDNEYTIDQYLDGYSSVKEPWTINFFGAGNNSNQAVHTISTKWDASGSDPITDISDMCEILTKRGLAATDVILGADSTKAFLRNALVLDLLNNRRFIVANEMNPRELPNGATFIGRVNANGHEVDIYSYTAQYIDDSTGTMTYYIPAKGCVVTAKNIGKTAHGAISQYEEGSMDLTTYEGSRVPHVTVNRTDNIKEIALQSRPLAYPSIINSWVYSQATT